MLFRDRLMVIDDEPDFAELVAETAHDLGYTCQAVKTAGEFRQCFGSFRPGFCIVDIVLPEEDGVQILEWLSEREERPRVAIVSAYNPYFLRLSHLQASKRGLEIVANLTKPVRLELLRAVIGPCR